MVDRLIGVATAPGPTPTTSMLCGASSTPGGARQHAHAALGQAVGGVARHRPILVHGSDVDDASAAALLDHLLRRELRAEEGALQIDGEHFFILLLRWCREPKCASRRRRC